MKRKNYSWSQLLARSFKVNLTKSPHCGGGVFAPNSKCRKEITLKPEVKKGFQFKGDDKKGCLKNLSWSKMLALFPLSQSLGLQHQTADQIRSVLAVHHRNAVTENGTYSSPNAAHTATFWTCCSSFAFLSL
jgi:hypothetical protein